ncbi:MAG: hypothetical protein JWR74_3208 [Polaromonas sp.]|nr:hypothetical protein [Polaromonas sp.]
MTALEIQTAHSAQQAMTPGWWAFAQTSVSALETDEATSATFAGLRAAVASVVKAQGYRPAAHELGEWWIIKNKLPAMANGRKSVKGRHDL